MKRFNDFEARRSSGSRELLPAGGYPAKIMDVKELTLDWGSVLLISFDISEGEYKGFFAKDYRSQNTEDKKWRGTYRLTIPKDDGSEKDGWTKKTFGNAIWSIEDSNSGFHWDWDETMLKGKNVGVLFRNREWSMNDNSGWTTECCAFTSISDIRENKFRMPKDKPLSKDNTKFIQPAKGFTEIVDDDLPFD